MPSFKASIVVLFAASHLAAASPVSSNSNEVNNAFSGSGGNASGGNVYSSESNNKSGLLAGIVGKSGLRGLGVNFLSSALYIRLTHLPVRYINTRSSI